MADGNVYLHPALERSQLRRKMAAALDQLLDAVDLIVRQLDAGSADPDLEPNLGAPEAVIFPWNIGRDGPAFEAMTWARGFGDEEEVDADLEPTLAMMQRRPGHYVSQLGWGRIECSPLPEDREREHDGREPECEDEGAQCDDGAPTYASHDQRRVVYPLAWNVDA